MVNSRFAAAAAAAMWLVAAAASAQTTVSGQVANAQGGAVPNAEATLRELPPAGAAAAMPNMPNMPNMPQPKEYTATAGMDGAFTITGVPAGQYVLMVDATGYERSSQELTVANQPQTLAIALTPLEIPGEIGRAHV